MVTLNRKTIAVEYLCNKDKRFAKVVSLVGTISYEPYDKSPYSFLVHEIIEQMLSKQSGTAIFNRLYDLCDGSVTPQTISKLSDEEIKSIGTAKNKVVYIRQLTNSVLNNEINLDYLTYLSDSDVIKTLTTLKGIGSWTAKMYLIFVLDRKDILPYEDVAFLQSYMWMYNTTDCSKQTIEKRCRKWKPYSSIAARYLYRALDMGFTKDKFHLFS